MLRGSMRRTIHGIEVERAVLSEILSLARSEASLCADLFDMVRTEMSSEILFFYTDPENAARSEMATRTVRSSLLRSATRN